MNKATNINAPNAKAPNANATNATNASMSNTEVNRILDLEKLLTGTRYLYLFMLLALAMMIIIYFVYPDFLNSNFGYSIFYTIILVFIFFGMWNFYSTFKQTHPNLNVDDLITKYGKLKSYGVFALVAGAIIALCFLLFSILGSGKNNWELLVTYTIVICLIIGSILVYKTSSSDSKILEKLPKHTQLFYDDRKKYTIILFLMFFVMSGLYISNPGGVMTKYGGATIFLTMFVGILLILVVKVYDYYFTDPKKSAELKGNFESIPKLFTFLKGFYILFGLCLSALFFYWILNALGFLDQNEDKSDKGKIIKTIVNIVFLIGMFTVLYKLVNASGYFANNPIFRLIFNTILYIPCLLVVIVDFIVDLFNKKPVATAATTAATAATTLHGATTAATTSTTAATAVTAAKSTSPIVFGNTTKNDLIFLGISVSVCGLYLLFNFVIIPFGMTKYYKQGGKQLINNPISTEILTNVATYENLNGSDKISYQYALSFWFYIDSFSPSTSASYLKAVPLLSYGDNPCIKYHGPSNSIIITVKQKTADADIVSSIQTLEKNIKVENIKKWNTIQDKIHAGVEKIKALPIGNEEDANGNRIIYKRSDILLQKWNNIVINYSGGTLDVFYNGELVKSAIEVVPKLNYDMLTIGTDNGISGNIANLMFFDHPLNYLTVNRLYTMLKDNNPPTISTIDETLIPLPSEY
jgi:hypothetical protein